MYRTGLGGASTTKTPGRGLVYSQSLETLTEDDILPLTLRERMVFIGEQFPVVLKSVRALYSRNFLTRFSSSLIRTL